MVQNHLFPTLESRYVRAKYLSSDLSGDDLLFELAEAVGGSKRAILPGSRLRKIHNPSEITQLFLERKTRSQNWITAAWKPDENPWLTNGLPNVGTTVTGRIVDFLGINGAIAQVEYLGETHTFSVLREHLPKFVRRKDVREVLDRGDLVTGNVLPADRENLRQFIDVESWLARVHQYWSTSAYYSKKSDAVAGISVKDTEGERERIDLTGRSVLVVEDSEELSEAVGTALQECGALVTLANCTSTPSLYDTFKESLKARPDCLLLDFQLEISRRQQEDVYNSVAALKLENPEMDVVVISGNLEAAPDYALRNGYGYLSKPITPYDIAKWISSPTTVEPSFQESRRQRQEIFSVEQKTISVIEKTDQLLSDISERNELIGAYWFIELAQGRFELRARSNSLKDVDEVSLVSALNNSQVTSLFRESSEYSGKLSRNDPLVRADACGPTVRGNEPHFFSLVLARDTPNPRLLVFLSDAELKGERLRHVTERTDHFDLLMENITQSEELDEISASASEGRKALGTLHEIRTELATVMAVLDVHQSDEPGHIVSMAKALLAKVNELSVSGLSGYQPIQANSFNVAQKIEEVCRPLRRYLRDQYPESVIEIVSNTEQVSTTNLHLNSMPLERTLVNLIDNAAFFCGTAPVSKIWITAKYNRIADIARPIEITVFDTGLGMSQVQRQRIFEPRSTGRPDISTGLGLYLSKTLLETIDGTIECPTRPRWSGTSFVIRLPERLN